MTDEPENDPEREAPKRPRVSRWAVVRSVGGALVSLGIIGAITAALLALTHPDTPLPNAWNPTIALTVSDPVTPLTAWKLRRTLNDPALCLAALDDAADMTPLDPLEVSQDCHVRNRVSLSSVGTARIDRIETSCATALRLALWTVHGIQPAAQDILSTNVTVLRQIGSYNCRPIRTSNGNSTRWSTHSTADAIDITGFDFADGTRTRLIRDWDDTDAQAAFLRAVHDSACTWFATTLGPEYNSLHADHFHLQARGWGTCR